MQPRTLAISAVAMTLLAVLAVSRGGCTGPGKPPRGRRADRRHSQ
jgi:hypothetical protein